LPGDFQFWLAVKTVRSFRTLGDITEANATFLSPHRFNGIIENAITRLHGECQNFAEYSAVVTLAKGLDRAEDPRDRRRRLIQSIKEHPAVAEDSNLPDPVELIREDRDR